MDRQARLTQAGQWIRETRERRGLNVHNLADTIGVSSKSVYQWEAGKSDIGATPEEVDERARQFAELFGMDVVEVRRNLGLWVPDGDTSHVDVDAELATALAEIRASREAFDQQMERVERLLAGHAERTGQQSEHAAQDEGQEETKRRRGA